MIPDLNADLGEHEPPERTAVLMRHVTSANVACGGHAGTRETMRRAVDLARAHGVRVGAHPGLAADFGRGGALPDAAAFLELLQRQTDALRAVTGGGLHHIKLHGSLYHATEQQPSLRQVFIRFVAEMDASVVIYALSGGTTVDAARAAGLTAWDEVFADRAYLPAGTLVPRSEPGAVLHAVDAVVDRVRRFARAEPIAAADGTPLRLPARTICLHGDSPRSETLAAAARAALDALTGA